MEERGWEEEVSRRQKMASAEGQGCIEGSHFVMAVQQRVDKRESKGVEEENRESRNEKRLMFIFGVLTGVTLQRKGSAVMPLEPSGTRER